MKDTAPRVRRNTRCLSSVLVMRGAQGDSWVPLRCKSWGCRRCRPKLAARWGHTLRHHKVLGFDPRRFLTITLDPGEIAKRCGCVACLAELEGRDFESRPDGCLLLDYGWQQKFLHRAWTRLIARVRRVAGKVSFWRVYEFHAGAYDAKRRIYNYRLHLHALVDSSLCGGGVSKEAAAKHGLPSSTVYDPRFDKWAEYAAALGLGRTICYDLPPGVDCWGYVFKYSAKLKPTAYERKLRLVSCSRDIKHPASGKHGEYEKAFVLVCSKRLPFKVEEAVSGAGGLSAFLSYLGRRKGVALVASGSMVTGPPGCLDKLLPDGLPVDNWGRSVWRAPSWLWDGGRRGVMAGR